MAGKEFMVAEAFRYRGEVRPAGKPILLDEDEARGLAVFLKDGPEDTGGKGSTSLVAATNRITALETLLGEKDSELSTLRSQLTTTKGELKTVQEANIRNADELATTKDQLKNTQSELDTTREQLAAAQEQLSAQSESFEKSEKSADKTTAKGGKK